MNILILEPYFGGSHKNFILELINSLPYEFELLTLPARKWKWRMRMAAPFFAEKLRKMKDDFDVILCSTFLDVASFRTLAPSWVNAVPVLTYFHENQFVYPVQEVDERDLHFAITNFTTALASDRLAFNSIYNLESFLTGIDSLLKKSLDMKIVGWEQDIRVKSTILHPGIDFTRVDQHKNARDPANSQNGPIIIWNHRWEHDKEPELFFEILFDLKHQGIAFQLIVLGQSFTRKPDIFEIARERLSDRIIHFGFAESADDYARLLARGDIVVSTTRHEFYGIAVIEAVRSGCRPLLPNRLSYPELFDKKYLYEQDDFADNLKSLLKNGTHLPIETAATLTNRFSWQALKEKYMDWLT